MICSIMYLTNSWSWWTHKIVLWWDGNKLQPHITQKLCSNAQNLKLSHNANNVSTKNNKILAKCRLTLLIGFKLSVSMYCSIIETKTTLETQKLWMSGESAVHSPLHDWVKTAYLRASRRYLDSRDFMTAKLLVQNYSFILQLHLIQPILLNG